MISKKDFKKIVSELLEVQQDATILQDALRKFDPDFGFISFGRYESLIVKTLELAMEDTSEWISWWLWEADAGKNTKIVNSVKNGKKKVPMKTIENLYDCIVNKKA